MLTLIRIVLATVWTAIMLVLTSPFVIASVFAALWFIPQKLKQGHGLYGVKTVAMRCFLYAAATIGRIFHIASQFVKCKPLLKEVKAPLYYYR